MIVYASMSMCVFVPLYFHDLRIVYMNVHADRERERERERVKCSEACPSGRKTGKVL